MFKRSLYKQSVPCLQNKCINPDKEPRYCGFPRFPETSGNDGFNQYKVLLELRVFAFAFLSLLNFGEELVMGMLVRVGRRG